MSALETIRKYVLACALALAVVSMVVVGLMMLTITYDVVVRFTFSAPTDWAYPVNAAGVLLATSLSVPYLYAKGRHISMDLLYRSLPARVRRAADGVTAAATAFLGLVLAVTSYRAMAVAIEGGLTGSGTFRIPTWVPEAALLLTGVLLTLVAVVFPPGGGEEAADPETEPSPAGAADRGEGRGDSDTGEGEHHS
jgi:TRAP-type C4-dicarboxylate transport system permease small subunit